MLRRPTVVVRTISNIFSSETAWPIKAKFYVEPPWEGGTKVCINGPGHMTKMAAMPIYGKNLKKSSETIEACDLKVGRYRQLIDFFKVYGYWRSRSFLDLWPRSCTYKNSNQVFSETTGPFWTNDPGHMTKMAAMPIYGKNLQKSSPEQASRFSWNLVRSIGVASPS